MLAAMLDFREFLALIKRVERTPLASRLYAKHSNRHGTGGFLDRDAVIRLWKEEQGECSHTIGLTHAPLHGRLTCRTLPPHAHSSSPRGVPLHYGLLLYTGEAPPPAILSDIEKLKGVNGTISESGLYHLLLSPSNDVADPEKVQKVYMDMTKPLPHYFIHASHKSYLCVRSWPLDPSLDLSLC